MHSAQYHIRQRRNRKLVYDDSDTDGSYPRQTLNRNAARRQSYYRAKVSKYTRRSEDTVDYSEEEVLNRQRLSKVGRTRIEYLRGSSTNSATSIDQCPGEEVTDESFTDMESSAGYELCAKTPMKWSCSGRPAFNVQPLSYRSKVWSLNQINKSMALPKQYALFAEREIGDSEVEMKKSIYERPSRQNYSLKPLGRKRRRSNSSINDNVVNSRFSRRLQGREYKTNSKQKSVIFFDNVKSDEYYDHIPPSPILTKMRSTAKSRRQMSIYQNEPVAGRHMSQPLSSSSLYILKKTVPFSRLCKQLPEVKKRSTSASSYQLRNEHGFGTTAMHELKPEYVLGERKLSRKSSLKQNTRTIKFKNVKSN